MDYKTSDMELMKTASSVLKYEDYVKAREKYQIPNPKKYVSANAHRYIMQEAIENAKNVIGRSGTEEEVINACLYFYICMDARKYRLDHRRARRDLNIDEMAVKYKAMLPAE